MSAAVLWQRPVCDRVMVRKISKWLVTDKKTLILIAGYMGFNVLLCEASFPAQTLTGFCFFMNLVLHFFPTGLIKNLVGLPFLARVSVPYWTALCGSAPRLH